MKVTYNWLKDFVDIKLAPQGLAEKLTMAGLEVISSEEKQGDFVFEIEITSNRPDWLSVIGIAREVAAITNSKFLAYSVERIAYSKSLSAKRYPLNAKTLKINIQDKKDCSLYTARIIKDVKVSPSPDWLKQRLELVGCRSVNNIVDITNYVLFETGEPLHAFDLDKIQGQEIKVRRAKNGEEIFTLDGQKRNLDKEILVIADGHKPIALAGIMGGKDTEVTESTKNILLEAAVFDSVLIRRGRQKLGLQTEAAYRFERGVCFSTALEASLRCNDLIQKLAGGKAELVNVCGKSKTSDTKINLSISGVERLLGEKITTKICENILRSLGFIIRKKNKDTLIVGMPAFRKDVQSEVDLIEEISRIYGFENIQQTLAAVKPYISIHDSRDLVSDIKGVLLGLGINEAITYSLIDKSSLRKFGFSEEVVEKSIAIRDPLSSQQEILRPALIPSLLSSVAHNLNQKQEYVAFFEIADIFSSEDAGPKQELTLGLIICGSRNILLSQGLVKDEASPLHIKGCFEAIFNRLGIKEYSFSRDKSTLEFHVYVKNEEVGYIREPSAKFAEQFEIKNKRVCFAQINLKKLLSHVDKERKYVSAPKYPGITRDISLVIKVDVKIKDLLEQINSCGQPLRSATVVDYYSGKQVPKGMRAVTISCFYQLDERTLTEEEVSPVHEKVPVLLKEKFNAVLR